MLFVIDPFMSFFMLHDFVTITVSYNITLALNPKF